MAKRKKSNSVPFDAENPVFSLRDLARSVLSDDAVFSGTDSELGEPLGFLPTPDDELNKILDREGRGIPMGRIIEAFGPPQTGKSSLAYAAIAAVQKIDGIGVIITAEGEFSKTNALAYGVDTDRVLVVDTNIVEECFTVINKILDQNPDKPVVIVVDSVAGLSTRAEYESDTFDYDRQAQIRAQLISKGLRKIGAKIPRTMHTLYLVNQVNEGETTMQGFKSKAKPVGGVRIGFYASIRLRLEPTGKFYRTKSGKKYVAGLEVKITTEKNRIHTPMLSVDMIIDFEKGLRSKASKKDDEEFGDD